MSNKLFRIGLISVVTLLIVTSGIIGLCGGFTRIDQYGVLTFDDGHSTFENGKPYKIETSFKFPWQQKIYKHYTFPQEILESGTYYFGSGDYYIDGTIEFDTDQPVNIQGDGIDNTTFHFNGR